jgi:hypothetical protein
MIERLVHALQALAAPAEEQLARCPAFVVKADELALDYADALLLITDCPQVSLTPEQQAALEAVDHLLDRMTGEKNEALWTEAALHTAPEWQEVRCLAREGLLALGQPVDLPPPRNAVYIRGRSI